MREHFPKDSLSKKIAPSKIHHVQLLSSDSLLGGGGGLGGLVLIVLGSDLLEVVVVLLEVSVLLESDEELRLLSLAVLLTFHADGLSLDLLELGVLVSIKYKKAIILT
jgi:hypothetical protein